MRASQRPLDDTACVVTRERAGQMPGDPGKLRLRCYWVDIHRGYRDSSATTRYSCLPSAAAIGIGFAGYAVHCSPTTSNWIWPIQPFDSSVTNAIAPSETLTVLLVTPCWLVKPPH